MEKAWKFISSLFILTAGTLLLLFIIMWPTLNARVSDKPAGLAKAASRFQISSVETIPGVADTVKLLIVRDHEVLDHCYFMVLDGTHVSQPVPIACF